MGEDRRAAGLVVGRGLELVDDAADDVVGDGLVVGRDVAVGVAVEVGAADLERVLAEGVGDLLHDPLGGDQALRAAEAAEGGVGNRVGLHRLGDEPYRRVVIGVVGVEERAVGDRAGEVGGEAAARGEGAVDREDAAVVVEADLVVVEEVVALAGRDHVVVAVGAELHRPVPLLGGDRGDRGEEVRLGLLAAEAAAHAPDDDRHRVRRHAEDVGDHVLHLGRVLGRGIDRDVVVLAGDREGDHALEVEVVLAADALHALQPVRRGRHRRGDVAALELQGLGDEGVVGGDRLGDVGDVRQRPVLDLRALRRAAGGVAGLGDHGEERLAVELDLASAKTGSSCLPTGLTSLCRGCRRR